MQGRVGRTNLCRTPYDAKPFQTSRERDKNQWADCLLAPPSLPRSLLLFLPPSPRLPCTPHSKPKGRTEVRAHTPRLCQGGEEGIKKCGCQRRGEEGIGGDFDGNFRRHASMHPYMCTCIRPCMHACVIPACLCTSHACMYAYMHA